MRPAALVVLLVALVLVGESLLPGRLFLPLQPDDFPEWRAGADPYSLHGHPHPDWCMSDVLHLLVPGLAVTQRAAERGELPLWDDGPSLGVPHLHQVHYAVLYPPAWLPVLLGLRGLAWMALLHLLIAGLGTLVYLTALGRSRTAAGLGAVAFLGSAWITARLHNFSVVGAAVWLPWVLWGLERAAQAAVPECRPPSAVPPRGAPRRYLAVAALALGLSFLAGFPQVTLWIAALALLFEALRVGSALRHGRRWARALAGAAAALAAGVALATPQLLPTLDYLAHDGLRGAQSADVIAAEALDPPLLWHLLVPDRYATGALTGGHPLALLDLPSARNPAAVNRAEVSLGIGVLGLLLALLAMAFGRGWRTRGFTLLAAGLLGLLVWPAAMRLGAELFPLLRLGSPRRLLLLSSFALCVLAAGGLDLLRSRRIGVTVLAWSLAVLLAGAALWALVTVPSATLDTDVQAWAERLAASLNQPGLDGAALLQLVPAENFRIAADRAASSGTVALIVAVLAVLLFRPRRQRTHGGWTSRALRMPALLLLLVGVELCASGLPLLRAARTEQVSERPGELALRPPPLLAALQEIAGDQPGPARIARLGDDPPWLRPNFAELFGFSDLSCYVPLAPRRASELLEAIEPGITLSGSAIGGLRRPETLASPVLDLLGVRAVLSSRGDLGQLPAGWSEVATFGEVHVLRNDEALPPAFVAPGVELLADPAERLARLAAPDFAPALLAVIEEPLPVPLPAPPRRPRPRPVEIRSWQPGTLQLHVSAGPPGLLVVGTAWHDGWRAQVNGASAPVVRADHALLAVSLPGAQDVDVLLEFQPPLVTFAFAGGGVAWLLVLLVLAWPRRPAAEPLAAGPASAEPSSAEPSSAEPSAAKAPAA